MKSVLISISVYTFLVFFSLQSHAQNVSKNYNTLDLSIAAGKGFSPALSYARLWKIGKSNHFRIGLGARLTSFWASDFEARTAPAKLTSGKESLAALFSEDIIANIDTFKLSKVQTNALNATLYLQYSLSQKFEFGMNIDLLGFTFGGQQSGYFIANSLGNSVNGQKSAASPSSFNALLISDSDYGSLNSELYGRYWLNDRFGIRAGLSFQFVEYKTDKKVTVANTDNDRWRGKILMPMVAICYKF